MCKLSLSDRSSAVFFLSYHMLLRALCWSSVSAIRSWQQSLKPVRKYLVNMTFLFFTGISEIAKLASGNLF